MYVKWDHTDDCGQVPHYETVCLVENFPDLNKDYEYYYLLEDTKYFIMPIRINKWKSIDLNTILNIKYRYFFVSRDWINNLFYSSI